MIRKNKPLFCVSAFVFLTMFCFICAEADHQQGFSSVCFDPIILKQRSDDLCKQISDSFKNNDDKTIKDIKINQYVQFIITSLEAYGTVIEALYGSALNDVQKKEIPKIHNNILSRIVHISPLLSMPQVQNDLQMIDPYNILKKNNTAIQEYIPELPASVQVSDFVRTYKVLQNTAQSLLTEQEIMVFFIGMQAKQLNISWVDPKKLYYEFQEYNNAIKRFEVALTEYMSTALKKHGKSFETATQEEQLAMIPEDMRNKLEEYEKKGEQLKIALHMVMSQIEVLADLVSVTEASKKTAQYHNEALDLIWKEDVSVVRAGELNEIYANMQDCLLMQNDKKLSDYDAVLPSSISVKEYFMYADKLKKMIKQLGEQFMEQYKQQMVAQRN